MDAETSAMVEQLYASGKVERPKVDEDTSLHLTPGGWYWKWDGGGMSAHTTEEAHIGWSLVQACWAKGWWLRKDGDSLSVFAPNLDVEDLSGPDEFMLVSHPCPIRAMVDALNGGG